MRGPGRPLLLGLLLVLGAAGPGVAAPREAADGQTLLRLIAEILQELRKGQAGEAKRLQLAGRREASDSALDPEEQRVEIVPRDLRMKDKFLKHLTVLFISVQSAANTFTDCTTTPETAPSLHTIKDVPGFLPGWLSVLCAWRDKAPTVKI
ncbi:ALK and LTK ligand 2 isoform X3 [Prionailurus iriomotensis]